MQSLYKKYWPVVVFPAAVVIVAYFGQGVGGGGMVGQPSPVFTRPLVCGEAGQVGDRFSLEEQRGHVVLLDFWASWCAPCRQSMPVLTEIANEYEDRGVRVIGVNVEPGRPAEWVSEVHHKLGGRFDCVQDTRASDIQRDFAVNSLPSLFLLDQDGVVKYMEKGFPGRDVLTRQIDKLLESR